jgi:large subunit ribosomal protein L21e
MPHSFGYRGRTRDLFKKGFRQAGTIALKRFQTTYRVGDIVDVKGDGAMHKGMPHKFYHGKTGTVWNVTRRAIGVIMHKQIGNRVLNKRVHFRIEHVKHSKCRQDFLNRVIANEKLKKEAREKKGMLKFFMFYIHFCLWYCFQCCVCVAVL